MVNPVELTQQLIRCPSVTPEDAGVMDVSQQALTGLGFTCQRQIFSEEDTAPVDNLFARLGTGAPHVCFAGHLDVVPPGDATQWQSDPFAAEIRDGYVYGRGAEDMKGAIACFVAAVERFLQQQKGEFNGSISVLMTLDEEGIACNGIRKMLPWLAERGQIPDVAIVGEPTNPHVLGQMIKVGRRGSMNCVLQVHGTQGHVAYPQLADNPVPRMVALLHCLATTPLDHGTSYFPPSNLEITSIDVGNSTHNIIPATVQARFNIRFNDSRPVAAIKNWLQDLCEDDLGPFELEMHVTGEAFHSEPTRLRDVLQHVCREVTGLMPELSTSGGTSDARFIKDYCPVMEFGTTGSTAHKVNECVAVETLEKLTEIYCQTLIQYFADTGGEI